MHVNVKRYGARVRVNRQRYRCAMFSVCVCACGGRWGYCCNLSICLSQNILHSHPNYRFSKIIHVRIGIHIERGLTNAEIHTLSLAFANHHMFARCVHDMFLCKTGRTDMIYSRNTKKYHSPLPSIITAAAAAAPTPEITMGIHEV